MTSNQPRPQDHEDSDDDAQLDADEVGEEIEEDGDVPMDEDEDENQIVQEIPLQNDSIAHFDAHTDSIFCIAQHPTNPNIVVTGGGDDIAYVFNTFTEPGPALPSSYNSGPPQQLQERPSLKPLQKLDGHTDSINAVGFRGQGQYVITAGLDGKIRAWRTRARNGEGEWTFLAEAKEVDEINWLAVNPNTSKGDVFAVGGSDGSVWVYKVDANDKGNELGILMTQYLHTESCTAGSWTPDGGLLATVSEDSSLTVWDVFGTGQAAITLTAEDQRFTVEGGLYSVACSSSMVAVGGAGGNVRVVGLPTAGSSSTSKASKNAKATSSSAGQILAALQTQSDGVETLSFSTPPLNLLAAGSVDGSIALFDTAHRFAMRRHIREAHENEAVVKVEFVKSAQKGYVLTSAGMDGVIRRWDVRGGTTAAGLGFIKEWQGHRGGGEGGGVLDFVQGGDGNRIVTAGDDGVSLVFRADIP